ncbi:uncharacterized protein SCHCODRAFT_02036178 [Schizophyllum commune H4-8]|uniref:uncharacterized protein n=1 Tax=Schizophyllum commune (strain H4-8 / FGSC 9210) TaxID=578458 RepID=UPI0021600494|nr:uncharacterized protein SCHCODRAFT_02036178 [Schizophyllum commune H4-8]KAI5900412.1 hypothetical protein SCHCODRAFT_02036178 [Schizophyllum commune H4-8]
MYRTPGTSDPRSPGNMAQLQKHKAELFSNRDKALSAVADQRIWPIDPRMGPSEAQEKQRAEALDELAAFAKAVSDLYELMTDVFARHKKQQEQELEDAKAEEEASRKRSREDEEAPAGPEQEMADILSRLELETREMKASFADQEAEIHEDVDNQVLELCDALGAPETIDVDEPEDDEDLPTPEERTEEQTRDMERLGRNVVDVAQTLASNEGAHQVVIRQRDEIAKLRAEVAEFDQEAPQLQKELEELTARQAKLEEELSALILAFEAHVARHPPTPPRSPMHQPMSLLEVPGYLSLERTEEGAPAPIEEDIAQEVRARLMPMLMNARDEVGRAFATEGVELVGTIKPQLAKVVRAMEVMAQVEAASVRPVPTAPMGVWGARPA